MKNLMIQTTSRIGALLPASLWKHILVQSFCMSWFIVLTAQIKVPFYPVPMTMEDWAIMFIALTAAPSVAVRATMLYLSYAAIGLPVLSSGVTGLALFSTPTAGFLVGFVLMSSTISIFKECYPNGNFWAQLGIVLVGNIVLFAAGLSWLSYLIGWPMALKVGLLPFVWVNLTKVLLATSMATYWKQRRH